MNNGPMYCEYRMKGMFKTAIIAGTGLVIGKYLGECVAKFINNGCITILKKCASDGNEYAIRSCEQLNVSYDTHEKHDSESVNKTIGFTVE